MTFNRIAGLVAIVVFLIAVGVGLHMSGSPAEQRLAGFDQQRRTHLARIRNSVDAYWRANRALPSRVDEDVIGIAMGSVPRDPETDIAYEYQVTGDDAYRLCARFSRESPQSMAGDFWAHGPGRHCFDFRVSEHGAE